MGFPILGTPIPQFSDSAGVPYVAGTLTITDPDTDLEKATYPTLADADAATNANANPIVLDSRGSCALWGLDGEDYKLVLKDSDAVTVWTIADLTNAAITQAGIGAILYPQTGAESSAGVTPTNYYKEPGNVLRYGTNTTPGTTDLSAALQDAIDSNNEVILPDEDVYLGAVVTLKSNLLLRGGQNTRIIKATGTAASQGILFADSGSSSTYLSDIVLRDFEIDGDVAANSFSEFQHLISLNGVDGVLVDNVRFTGPQGDGLYIGSGATGGQERHNLDVKVTNCTFDGVNKDNRNAISVIDCDGLTITGNHFRNFTKSTMPGAIDLEPDSSTFHVIKDVTIANNKFKNIGGNVAAIGVVLNQATYTTQPETFSITGNVFDVTVSAFAFYNNNTGYTRPLDVTFSGNSGKCSKPFDFQDYIRGLSITGNTMYVTSTPLLGFNATDSVVDATISGNTFTGDDSVTGIVMRSADHVIISDNVMTDFADYSILIGLSGATADAIKITDNSFRSSAVGVEFSAGTITNTVIENNDFVDVTTAIEGTIPADTIIRNNMGADELVTTTNVIEAAEGGKTFYLNAAGGFTSTLPAPHRGLKYTFIVKTAPTTAYIITTTSGANVLYGTYLDIVGELVYFSAQDTLNFVASTSVVGDRLEVESDGTNWYCKAFSGANGGVTVSVT